MFNQDRKSKKVSVRLLSYKFSIEELGKDKLIDQM